MKYIILFAIIAFVVWQGYGLVKDLKERKRKKEDNKDEKEQNKNEP